MRTEDFAYVVTTQQSFDEAVVSVLRVIEQKGWALFGIYDVGERLAAKGFTREPLKIIEVCSAKHAAGFLETDTLASLCMPCKVNVFEESGEVKIASMRPSVMTQFFPEVDAESAAVAERDIREIVDVAAR